MISKNTGIRLIAGIIIGVITCLGILILTQTGPLGNCTAVLPPVAIGPTGIGSDMESFPEFSSGEQAQKFRTSHTDTGNHADNRGAGVHPVPAAGEINVSAERQVIEADNRFAFDLYAKLRHDQNLTGRNLFFSPYSISTAFALTYEGARSVTADEIRTAFHLPADDQTRREGFAGLSADLNRGSTIRTANALWANANYSFLPEYTGTAKKYYAADTRNLDFGKDPEGSRAVINGWVENQTEGKIQELLPVRSLDPLTALVITNAVYFKGSWEKEFNKAKTGNSSFWVSRDRDIDVPMMYLWDKDALYQYGETGGVRILKLPYSNSSGKKLSMLVLLPESESLDPAENLITEWGLTQVRGSLEPRKVEISFPKFSIDATYNLPKTLSAMGMPAAFSSAADLSGMDGTHLLYVDKAIHKAHIEVNEEGTEAAAASVVVVRQKGGPSSPDTPLSFRADHPFVFLIQDDDTDNILFIGRVVNPAEG